MVVTIDELRDYEEHPSPIREAMRARLKGWAPQCHQTSLRSFEVSSCDDDEPYVEREVDDFSIQAWFEEDMSQTRCAAGKLRLLYGKVNSNQFPFSREGFQTISKYLDLSLEHISVMNVEHDSVITSWTDRRDPETPCPSYCTRSAVFYDGGAAGYNYAVTYLFVHNNPSKRITHALLLQTEFIPHPEYLQCQPPYLDSIIDYLRRHSHLVGYDPFFTATTLCKAALPLHQKMVIILSSRISSLDGRLTSLGAGADPLALDFVKETTRIQAHTQQLSVLREMVERQLLVLTRIIDDKRTRKYQKTLRRNDSDRIEKRRQDVLDDVEMVAEGAATANYALLKWIDRELLTVKSLSIMVYNFMAVKEARVTSQIANASLHDSSAMKTIASLTMIFLPGTAIATILSTPFFVWDEDIHNLITRQFWLFFAITIPATLLVIFSWRLALYFPRTSVGRFVMGRVNERSGRGRRNGDEGVDADGATWKIPPSMV